MLDARIRRSAASAAWWLVVLGAPLLAQDAERATHGDEASRPRVSFEHVGADHLLRQYQLGCLSHLSYLLVSGKVAAVIDPQRDVDHYLADAAARGADIRFVLLTHAHADFVAGHTELAARAGAEVLIASDAGATFPHRGLHDGDRIAVGSASIEAWSTPGHTPSSMTFLVRVRDANADPAFALTGDTLFVGGVGRPDLLEVPPEQLAAQAWSSVQRLAKLPDATLVLPAHGAGSLCGAHLSPQTTSTIGNERATNPCFRFDNEAAFVADLSSQQLVAPQYFAHNVRINLAGPPLVERGAEPPARIAPAALHETIGDAGWLVDLRDQQAYAAGHVAGAINIALRGRLDTWTGIVVPFGAPLVLAGDDAEVREGAFRLRRIGYDRIAGRLDGDAAAWRAAGLDVRHTTLLSPAVLFAALQKGTEPVLVDVRTKDEFADVRLGPVVNVPVTDSARLTAMFPRRERLAMICNSAYRSSMAIGLAERAGFTDVTSLDGGLDAWIAVGLPVVGRAAPARPAAAIVLPEPIDAALLQRVLAEQPKAYAVVDVRPAWQFAEWHVPGATNVAPDAVAAHVDAMPPDVRVVLVDRDGTTAFAIAGALGVDKARRSLRVLLGGTAAYYRSATFGGGAGMPAALPASPATAPVPAVAPAKKRGAGC